MTKAYSYIRMSTDAQLKGDSLRRQTEASEAYAKDNNLDLVESLEDIGISAFNGKNLESGPLANFLELAKQGKIEKGSNLIVESLDRISRQDPQKALRLFLEIIEYGIVIVTLQDGEIFTQERATKNPLILLTSLLVMIRANEESEMKSFRGSEAWKNKRHNASTQIITSVCPSWLKALVDKSGYEVIPQATDAIKLIFQYSLSNMGALAITKKLNQNSVPTIAKSRKWNLSYVKKILANEAVTGTYQPHRLIDGKRVPEGEVIEGYFPVIISKADFIKSRNGRNNRSGKGGAKGEKFSNLFSHVPIICSCGAKIRYFNKGKNASPTLQCDNAYQGAGCKSAPWNYDNFETAILQSVKELDIGKFFAPQPTGFKKMLENEIIVLEENISTNECELQKNYIDWMNVDTAIKLDLEKVLLEKKQEIITKKIELSKLKDELEVLHNSTPPTFTADITDLIERMKTDYSETEIYKMRSDISGQIFQLIKKITMNTGMIISPWEVSSISGAFRDQIEKRGYKSKEDIEKFLGSKLGQKLYIEDERYLNIAFNNSSSAMLKPSSSMYLKFNGFTSSN